MVLRLQLSLTNLRKRGREAEDVATAEELSALDVPAPSASVLTDIVRQELRRELAPVRATLDRHTALLNHYTERIAVNGDTLDRLAITHENNTQCLEEHHERLGIITEMLEFQIRELSVVEATFREIQAMVLELKASNTNNTQDLFRGLGATNRRLKFYYTHLVTMRAKAEKNRHPGEKMRRRSALF